MVLVYTTSCLKHLICWLCFVLLHALYQTGIWYHNFSLVCSRCKNIQYTKRNQTSQISRYFAHWNILRPFLLHKKDFNEQLYIIYKELSQIITCPSWTKYINQFIRFNAKWELLILKIVYFILSSRIVFLDWSLRWNKPTQIETPKSTKTSLTDDLSKL